MPGSDDEYIPMKPAEMKFLIVDDHPNMRQLVRDLLRDIGYDKAEEAEDGAVALQKLREGSFDLVVSDITMPNMNGFELLGRIRAEGALRDVPVLVMAGEARKDDVLAAARAGANGYIVKPFTKGTLENKVERILARASA
jgi:two-component system, chemotaxis family, chemotaxis protein CheY